MKILLKRNGNSGVSPSINEITLGEVVVNTADGKLFTKTLNNGVYDIVEIGGGVSAFSELDDTTIINPQDGDYVKFDAVSGTWVNESSQPLNLDALADVSASNPAVGQVLKWDGTNWVAANDEQGTGTGTGGELVKYIGTISGNTGYIINGRIDDDIGADAINLGVSATSSGRYSLTEGYYTTASGYASHAEGGRTLAEGLFSHAEGYDVIASGDYSHAEGEGTSATNTSTHTEGAFTQAHGTSSHAEGYHTIAQNKYMHAAGKYNTGTAIDTIHETGIGTSDADRRNAFEIYTDGKVVAPELTTTLIDDANTPTRVLITKEYADANYGGGGGGIPALVDLTDVTITNLADADYIKWDAATSQWVNASLLPLSIDELSDVDTTTIAPTIGQVLKWDGTNWTPADDDGGTGGTSGELVKYTGATSGNTGYIINGRTDDNIGTDAINLGFGSQTTGQISFATGYFSNAIGFGSYAEGAGTQAYGSYSHAEGSYASSIGNISHAEGFETEARGYASHAEGIYTIAQNEAMHAEGKYNVGTATDTIHETGIGTSITTRKNAFEIYTDGRIKAPELTTTLINDPRSLTTKEYVDAQAGGSVASLNDIGDVTVLTSENGDFLRWDSTSAQWKNARQTPVLGYYTLIGTIDIDNTTNTYFINMDTTETPEITQIAIKEGKLNTDNFVFIATGTPTTDPNISINYILDPNTTTIYNFLNSFTINDAIAAGAGQLDSVTYFIQYINGSPAELMQALTPNAPVMSNNYKASMDNHIATVGYVKEASSEFTATSGQTTFVISNIVTDNAKVFVNGFKTIASNVSVSDDGTNTTVTIPATNANDIVEILYHI